MARAFRSRVARDDRCFAGWCWRRSVRIVLRLPPLPVLPRGVVTLPSRSCQFVFWLVLFYFFGLYDRPNFLRRSDETHSLPLRRFIIAGRLLTEDHQGAIVIDCAANLKRTRADQVSGKFLCLVVPLAADKNLPSFVFDFDRVVGAGHFHFHAVVSHSLGDWLGERWPSGRHCDQKWHI